MSRSRQIRRQRQKRKQRLATGAGSGRVTGLVAPPGFERITVMDDDSRPSIVIRRRDNLVRLRQVLGVERVEALTALRMAAEMMERGLTPRCALDRSPSGGPDGYLAVIQHRIDDGRLAAELWAAVPENALADVRAVVVEGKSIEALAREQGGRLEVRRAVIRRKLGRAADAVGAVLDARFGRARMRRG